MKMDTYSDGFGRIERWRNNYVIKSDTKSGLSQPIHRSAEANVWTKENAKCMFVSVQFFLSS